MSNVFSYANVLKDAETIKGQRSRNALLSNAVDRIPQANRAENLALEGAETDARTEAVLNLSRTAANLLPMPPDARRTAVSRLLQSPSMSKAFQAIGFDPSSVDVNALDDATIDAQLQELAAYGSGGSQTGDSVQSAFTTPDNTLGYLTRGGQVVDTRQGVQGRSLNFERISLPDGRTVLGRMDPNDGSVWAPDGTLLFSPVRGGAQQTRPQPTSVDDLNAGVSQSPAEQAAAVAEAQAEVESASAAQTKQEARLEMAQVAADLLAMPGLKGAFGFVEGALPERSQSIVDARAQKDRLVGLLSLESRQKMKGSGQISDFESRLLGQSATVLTNPRISDEFAEAEIRKIAGILSGELAIVENDEQFDALPPGTRFVGPDGKVRTKQ